MIFIAIILFLIIIIFVLDFILYPNNTILEQNKTFFHEQGMQKDYDYIKYFNEHVKEKE